MPPAPPEAGSYGHTPMSCGPRPSPPPPSPMDWAGLRVQTLPLLRSTESGWGHSRQGGSTTQHSPCLPRPGLGRSFGVLAWLSCTLSRAWARRQPLAWETHPLKPRTPAPWSLVELRAGLGTARVRACQAGAYKVSGGEAGRDQDALWLGTAPLPATSRTASQAGPYPTTNTTAHPSMPAPSSWLV